MAKGKPDTAPSEAELQRQHERWLFWWSGIKTVLITAILTLGGCVVAYVSFYLPIQASRGETTVITQSQNWVGNVQAHVAIAWTAAAGTGIWGYLMRRKMIRERQEKDARITELE